MKLKEEIRRYGKNNGYEPSQFDEIKCECGNTEFKMYSDDNEGGCGLICVVCESEISVMDSADYMDEVVQNTCSCGNENLHVTQGLAFYEGSEKVRWVYVGAKCDKCEVKGVYVDWHER